MKISDQYKMSEKLSDKNLEICVLKEENLKFKVKIGQQEEDIMNLNKEILSLKKLLKVQNADYSTSTSTSISNNNNNNMKKEHESQTQLESLMDERHK